MPGERKILYAGYGANRDPEMIEAIIGKQPENLGQVALMGMELCVQKLEQTPTEVPADSPAPLSVRELLQQTWGADSGFETYTIRPIYDPDKVVLGTLFGITTTQRALIAEWEMIDYGWYQDMDVQVRQSKSLTMPAVTEGLRIGQPIDRVVNGIDYKTYLNDKDSMLEKAEQTRLEYLARQSR